MMYHWEGDALEVDGRFAFAEQRAVLARGPLLTPVDYLDEVWVKGVAGRLRPDAGAWRLGWVGWLVGGWLV
jgi:hypothetical protein